MLGLFALFGAVSALDPFQTFHYVKHPSLFRRSDDACQLCYGDFDCMTLDECGYNAAATEVLHEDDRRSILNKATSKVDSMMYDLVLEDSLKEYTECIPLISSHSNCNKDNTCLGCKTCDCDESGHWKCRDTYKCAVETFTIDRRVFTTVVDSLRAASRYKRSIDGYEETTSRNVFVDLADWVYESRPVEVPTIPSTEQPTTVTSTKPSSVIVNEENNTNLKFDEILNNDNLEEWIKSEETDNGNRNVKANSHEFLKTLKNLEEGLDDTVQINNPLNIELLKNLKKYLKDIDGRNGSTSSSNDQPNSINAIMTDIDEFDFEKQQSYTNTAAKRNVRELNATTTEHEIIWRNWTATIENETSNVTPEEKELQHIIDVVDMLINNERKELNHLNFIKVSIFKFLKKIKGNSSQIGAIEQQYNVSQDYAKRSSNWKVDMLNFYMNNLKKDVKNSIKDIYAIQRLKKLGVSPVAGSFSNLKPLLFALTSYYMNKTNNFRLIKKSKVSRQLYNNVSPNITTLASNETKPQRRSFEENPINYYKIKLIKRALTRMLSMVDSDTEETSTGGKGTIKHIFNRIVSKQYANAFPAMQLYLRDPNYNLTDVLTTLNKDWLDMPGDIHNLHPADLLYNMKLMHLTVSQGIAKIKDALNSVQFGYSRRVNLIDENLANELFTPIKKYFSEITKKIKKINFEAVIEPVPPKQKDESKKSIWYHIKNAFSKSKNDLLSYFHQTFPKPRTYIVNDMVKKRLEEVNRQKFLEVMKRWQENFDSYKGRQKRSVKNYRQRMKNILPKYLRDKVNPSMYDKNKKSKGVDNNKNNAARLERTQPLKVNFPLHGTGTINDNNNQILNKSTSIVDDLIKKNGMKSRNIPHVLSTIKKGVKTQNHQ